MYDRGDIIAGVLRVTAGTSVAAGSDGIGGDAGPMVAEASKFGDGAVVIGSMVIWIFQFHNVKFLCIHHIYSIFFVLSGI